MKAKNVLSLALCGILFALAHPLLCSAQSTNPICVEAAKVPIPDADKPPQGSAFDFNTCEAPLELTPSPGHPVDLTHARYCAYAGRDAKSGTDENDDMVNIGGNAGLAMIYAGGKGVAPNLPLAIRFACDIRGDWDDGTDVAKMLAAKQQQGATRVDFDICDSPTGRQLNYLCLLRNGEIVSREIDRAGARLNANGSAAQLSAFRRLLEARKKYLDLRPRDSGTVGVAQSNMEEDIEIDRQWVQTFDDLKAGKLPHYTEADFRKADANLNSVYRDARSRTSQCQDDFCTHPDQLLAFERAWLAYRDAWVAYAILRWPAVEPVTWKTWLTLDQIETLDDVVRISNS